MVFDGYDDPVAFPNIWDFIPDGELGAILVNSRHADAGGLMDSYSLGFIELPGLEKGVASNLLFQQSQIPNTNLEDAEMVVERLEYHPLLITQAGTYIKKRKMTFSDFWKHYESRNAVMLQTTPQLTQYRKSLGDAEEQTALNVFKMCELSFEQLKNDLG